MENKPWKPSVAQQMVIGQQVMQGWSREKILSWWDEELINQPNKSDEMAKWLIKNIKY